MALTQIETGMLKDAAVTDAKVADVAAGKLTGSRNIPKGTMPTGAVLQVVNQISAATRTSTSSTTPVTIVSASITPLSATSKILVIANLAGIGRGVSSNNAYTGARIARNSTEILYMESQANYDSSNTNNEMSIGGTGGSIQDSPGTTSSVTYALQFWNSGTPGGSVWTDRQSSITLLEIAA